MASSTSSPMSLFYLFTGALLASSSLCNCSHHANGGETSSHHVVAVRTFLPKEVCSSSSQGSNHTGLKVVQRHGPCSPTTNGRQLSKPTPGQILLQDESRADSLRRLRRRNREAHQSSSSAATSLQRGRPNKNPRGSLATAIPARFGRSLGTANYIVTVGFGTPKRDLSVVFDTGSDLTWVQCSPCVGYCYQQQEPIFDPAQSTSYHNVSCTSADCLALRSATGNAPGCSADNCLYGIQYGDNSFSVGFFATETLTLAPNDVFTNIKFGCGERNRGLFGRTAGLLGLGRDPVSLPSQMAVKYSKSFSYCLPSSASSTGYLIMGPTSGAAPVKYTPMLTDSSVPSFYFLDLIGISVGGRQLQISSTVFTVAGTLIDSGTVITRLPPPAYVALRSAFRQLMSRYPTAPALSILDTCYDFSGYGTVSVPKVALLFRGDVNLDVDVSGIMFGASLSQVCLAFAGNAASTDMAIVGNMQQQTYKVVYDVAGGTIGFGAGGCS